MAKFSTGKVPIRERKGFVPGWYNLELVEAKAGESRNAVLEITAHFKIYGSEHGYNNARVWEHLYFADVRKDEDSSTAFEVSTFVLRDMGVPGVDSVEGSSLRVVRDKILELLKPGFKCRAELIQVRRENSVEKNLKAVDWAKEVK